MSMVSNHLKKTQGGFYGRTYISEKKNLVPYQSGLLQCTEEELVFLHTNFTDKSSVLVVELIICKEFNFETKQISGGYTVCPIFDLLNTSKIAYIQSGTPRQIGNESISQISQKNRVGKTSIMFDIRENDKLKPLLEITPANCFIGSHETVPGLQGDRILMNSNVPLQIMLKQTIYLHNLSIQTSTVFDQRFE